MYQAAQPAFTCARCFTYAAGILMIIGSSTSALLVQLAVVLAEIRIYKRSE
jgi:predicted membrane channel-forming protein YqfA (hemolysin III family)